MADSCGYACARTRTGGTSGVSGIKITPHRAETILSPSQNAHWPVPSLFSVFSLPRLFEEHIPKFLLWQTHPDGAAVKPRKRPHSESTNTHVHRHTRKTRTRWAQGGMCNKGSQVARVRTVRWGRWNRDQFNTKLSLTEAVSDYKVRYEIKIVSLKHGSTSKLLRNNKN